MSVVVIHAVKVLCVLMARTPIAVFVMLAIPVGTAIEILMTV